MAAIDEQHGPYVMTVGKLRELLANFLSDVTVTVDSRYISFIDRNYEWHWNSRPLGYIDLLNETCQPAQPLVVINMADVGK